MAGRGRFIAIVGPDGAGKTTLANHLLQEMKGPVGYVHFRPNAFEPLAERPLDLTRTSSDKTPPGNWLFGWLRLLASVVRFWVGYLLRIAPLLRRGGSVVADRWAYGYVAQPRALRFFGPSSLARLAVRLVPSPDLVINLTAPAYLIAARKAELSEQEISEELELWASLPVRSLVTLDASMTPEKLTARVLSEIQLIE